MTSMTSRSQRSDGSQSSTANDEDDDEEEEEDDDEEEEDENKKQFVFTNYREYSDCNVNVNAMGFYNKVTMNKNANIVHPEDGTECVSSEEDNDDSIVSRSIMNSLPHR